MQFWRHKKLPISTKTMSWRGKGKMPFKKKIQNTAKQHVFKAAAAIWRTCQLHVTTPTKDSTDTILGTLHPDRRLGRYSGHLVFRGRQRERWGMGQGRERGKGKGERGSKEGLRYDMEFCKCQEVIWESGVGHLGVEVFMNLSSWNVVELLDLYSGRSRKDKLGAGLFHR